MFDKTLRYAAKKAFRIEYILLVSATITLISTEYFKILAYRQFDALDYTLSARYSNKSEEIQAVLSKQIEPYLYFDKTLSSYITDKGIIADIIDFKYAISTTQRRMTIGFDHLLVFCATLFAISIGIITKSHLKEKSEREQQKSLEEEQAKFRRDLHDSVAQDALDIAPSEPFEKLIRKTLETFEQNWLIKTDCFIASDRLQSLNGKARSEILKILQEALSNIARHSSASAVQVKIIDLASALRIIIADNGTGLQENSTDGQRHHGLANMKARAESIGGTLEITNNGGLTIAITIADSLHR